MSIDTIPADYGDQLNEPSEAGFGTFNGELGKHELVTPSLLTRMLDGRRYVLKEGELVEQEALKDAREAVMLPPSDEETAERTRQVLVRVGNGSYREAIVTGTPELGYAATSESKVLFRGEEFFDIGDNKSRTLTYFIGPTEADSGQTGEPETPAERMIEAAIRAVDASEVPRKKRRFRRALGRTAA
jgi:hypothetical protein